MLELIFLLLGIAFGTFTGLIPGIHVNTVIAFILPLLPSFDINVYCVVVMIIAMSVTHTFVDYVPSIFLGAPDDDAVLSVLPGHRMLLKGEGYDAVRLTVPGVVGALVLSLFFLPFSIKFLPFIYSLSKKVLPFILSSILLYMVLTEKGSRKFFAALVTAYAGILGLILMGDEGAIFPALTGFFGMSTLLLSMKTHPNIPKQKLGEDFHVSIKGIVLGSMAGIFSGLFPSVGASQSATLMQNFFGRREDKEFLIAMGGVNTIEAIFAFLSLYLIGKPRSGASIAVEKLLNEICFKDFLFMLGTVLASTLFASVVTLRIAKFFACRISEIDYRSMSVIVLLFLIVIIQVIAGIRGLIIALTSACIGIIAQLTGVKKSQCMSFLMLPTILMMV